MSFVSSVPRYYIDPKRIYIVVLTTRPNRTYYYILINANVLYIIGQQTQTRYGRKYAHRLVIFFLRDEKTTNERCGARNKRVVRRTILEPAIIMCLYHKYIL